jgi:flagellar biosynthesis/type III secretory pathway M-ring protein FliF/YscJ
MLNFLIWVILIYFALLIIWRYVIPFFVRRTLRKFERRMQEQADFQHHKYNESREGEVRIDHIPDPEPAVKHPEESSDYVDFEEINNNNDNQS